MSKPYNLMTKDELIKELQKRDKKLDSLVETTELVLHFYVEHPIMVDPYKVIHPYLDELKDPPWDSYYSE